MSIGTHNAKRRNARDLDEVSTGLARMRFTSKMSVVSTYSPLAFHCSKLPSLNLFTPYLTYDIRLFWCNERERD